MSKADEIKVIDLLNRIANGEEVPKFWWNGCIHEIDEYGKIYDTYCGKYKEIIIECLNDEVKLIEEQTIDIDSIEELQTGWSESGAETDIIKYINKTVMPSIKHLNKEIQSIKK